MTRYNYFNEIQSLHNKLCKMEQTSEFGWNKMIRTGNLSLYDYGVGYIDLSIYYMYVNNNHSCRLWFGTNDDGDFGANVICKTEAKAKKLVKLAVEFFRDMTEFPSDEELNIELQKIGIYVTYE